MILPVFVLASQEITPHNVPMNCHKKEVYIV